MPNPSQKTAILCQTHSTRLKYENTTYSLSHSPTLCNYRLLRYLLFRPDHRLIVIAQIRNGAFPAVGDAVDADALAVAQQVFAILEKGKTGGEVAQLRCLPGDTYSRNLVRHTYQVRQCL